MICGFPIVSYCTTETSHIRQNGVSSENLELQTTSNEEFSLEPSSHVTSMTPVVEQEEGGGRYSPQEMHKDKQSGAGR